MSIGSRDAFRVGLDKQIARTFRRIGVHQTIIGILSIIQVNTYSFAVGRRFAERPLVFCKTSSPSAGPVASQAARKRAADAQKGTAGTIVFALASTVLSKAVASKKFGSHNYNKTYLRGTVLRAFDGRKEGGKQAVWKVEASWVLPGHPEGQRYSVRRQDVHLQQPAPNPITTVANFPDSINHRDVPTRGSTTYRPSAANNPPISAAASSASAVAAAAAADTWAQKRAHDGGDSNDTTGSGRRRRRSGASGGQQKHSGTFDSEQDRLNWMGPPPSPAGASKGENGALFCKCAHLVHILCTNVNSAL